MVSRRCRSAPVLNGPRPARPAHADNPDVSTRPGGSPGTAAPGLPPLVLERLPALNAGAPKMPTVELLEALEPVRRGPYCDAALWVEWEETRAKARGPVRAIGGRVAEEEEP